MKHREVVQRTFFLTCIFLLTVFAKMDINSEYNVPVAAYSVCSADIDLDDDEDLIIGHRTAWQQFRPTITIMKNINQGFFEIIDTSKIFAGYQENIFAIDVNNDVSPDIVTFTIDVSSGSQKRYVRIFYNSNGTFENFTDFNLNCSKTFSGITYGDVDGNGSPDLIVSSNGGQLWGILYNDGNGNFSSPEYHYVTDTYPTGLACGDLNNDGRDDIIVFGAKVEVYFSLASGLQDTLLCEHQSNGWIDDLNHDGKSDIICYDDLALIGLTGVTMFENTTLGKFLKHDELLFPFSTFKFYLSDFNNDDLPDVLFQLYSNTGHIIYYNKGDFQLSDSTFIPVDYYGETWRKCCCADLDGNGFNDVVTVRTSNAKLTANVDIKFNDGHGHFIDHPLGTLDKKSNGGVEIMNVHPNPFIDQTSIDIVLSEAEIVNLSVHDFTGRLITNLLNEKMAPGHHKVIWNRVDEYGEVCKSGIYFAVFKTQSKKYSFVKLVIYK